MTDVRSQLNAISQALLRLHKSLMLLQKAEFESASGRALAPQELLQALFANPDFEWLRFLSKLVARIDEAADDKEVVHAHFPKDLFDELNRLFGSSDWHADFKIKLENAIGKDPSLQTEVDSLRGMVARLKTG